MKMPHINRRNLQSIELQPMERHRHRESRNSTKTSCMQETACIQTSISRWHKNRTAYPRDGGKSANVHYQSFLETRLLDTVGRPFRGRVTGCGTGPSRTFGSDFWAGSGGRHGFRSRSAGSRALRSGRRPTGTFENGISQSSVLLFNCSWSCVLPQTHIP